MKKTWVYFLIAVTVVSCVALSGCKKAAEKAIENKLAREGVDAKVDSSGGKMTIQTKDGTTVVTGGKDAKVPENFPKDVYVYEGATIRGSVSVPNGFNLVMETGDSADKVLATIKSKMSGLGWKEEMTMNQDKTSMVGYKKGERTTMVNINADKITHITLTTAEKQ